MSKTKEVCLSIILAVMILTMLATKGPAIAEGHWWMRMLLAPFTEVQEASMTDNDKGGYYVHR